jgi:type VI secretion system protein ImpE
MIALRAFNDSETTCDPAAIGALMPQVETSYQTVYETVYDVEPYTSMISRRWFLEAAAEEERPLRGTLNGAEIHELSDSHDLLGPFLEVVMEGHYAWVPWDAIQSLAIPEPRYLRNTVWSPASLTLSSGDRGDVLVFSMYVDSHLQADDDVKLGRRTIWSNPAEFTVAYGQKVITTGDTDCPILEMRTLEVEPCQ